MKVQIEKISEVKEAVARETSKLDGFGKSFFELRLEVSEGKGAGALKGSPLSAGEDFGISIGLNCNFELNGTKASGFAGEEIGEKELNQIAKKIKELKEKAFKRAKANAKNKLALKKKFGKLAENIYSPEFEEFKPVQEVFKISFKKNPRDISIQELEELAVNASKQAMQFPEVKGSYCIVGSGFERKLYCNSEGSIIDQTTPITNASVFASAFGKGPSDYSQHLGDYAGLEVLNGENSFGKSLEDFAVWIAQGTAELSNAPAAKTTGKEVNVVTDSNFNCLLVHEIVGHPTEADRALKREAAWAGRAWWFHSLQDNLLGQQVASENVSVFSDPAILGYGHYKYDDEGIKGRKVYNIKNGVLNEFLNSRETALILGQQANGSMRATTAALMPIVRMNNTCFEKGSWNAEEIIRETREGFYVVGEKIPSIGDTRQNFRITCWKLFEIKNGELGQLYRLGGITADSHNFLKSIDAVGKDFQIFPVPNCGKGTPMQTMRVGNGGPTLRARARITGSE